jgi:hypothetical protein
MFSAVMLILCYARDDDDRHAERSEASQQDDSMEVLTDNRQPLQLFRIGKHVKSFELPQLFAAFLQYF